LLFCQIHVTSHKNAALLFTIFSPFLNVERFTIFFFDVNLRFRRRTSKTRNLSCQFSHHFFTFKCSRKKKIWNSNESTIASLFNRPYFHLQLLRWIINFEFLMTIFLLFHFQRFWSLFNFVGTHLTAQLFKLRSSVIPRVNLLSRLPHFCMFSTHTHLFCVQNAFVTSRYIPSVTSVTLHLIFNVSNIGDL